MFFSMIHPARPEKTARRDAGPAVEAAPRIPGEIYARSRFLILSGVGGLAAGSGLLLLCKLPLPEAAATLAAFAGGGLILLGNGAMIYGLLVYAGWQPD